MLGCSTGLPASIDHARRTNWACDHASGVADRVPSPLGKPGVPDGGWSSHTCSGISPPSLAAPAIAASWAFAVPPAVRLYSPRSPAKIGHARPCVIRLPSGNESHGAPLAVSP